MASFELVNLCSGNQIGEFDTEAEALRDIAAVVQRRGPGAIAGIALGEEDDQGRTRIIAEGDELLRRAQASQALPA